MIRKIKTFTRLSRQRKVLAVQAFAAAVYTFFLFAFFNKQARFGKKVAAYKSLPNSIDEQNIVDIAWAIKTVDRIVPWKNVCRHQAYQAKLLCHLYNLPCFIFVGFKKDIDKNEIQAHAWTIAGDTIITGFCDPTDYVVQAIYSNS